MYDTPDETHTGLCHDLSIPAYTEAERIANEISWHGSAVAL